MALTEEQWKRTIVVELNGGELLSANIDALWDQHTEWTGNPRVRYLLTKLSAIDLLLGNLDETISAPVEGDLRQRYSERHSILLDLRRGVVTRIQAIARRSGRGAHGLLAATAIIRQTNSALPDPNDPRYYGDVVNPPWVLP